MSANWDSGKALTLAAVFLRGTLPLRRLQHGQQRGSSFRKPPRCLHQYPAWGRVGTGPSLRTMVSQVAWAVCQVPWYLPPTSARLMI